uniref:RNA helicase n=1 Tax=Ditylenchus dipsaci TaxID=166011 RepID=A0A915CQF2_9BILA
MSFKELGIGRFLTNQLDELNLKTPTTVQSACIPKILEGCDVLGCAKTELEKRWLLHYQSYRSYLMTHSEYMP